MLFLPFLKMSSSLRIIWKPSKEGFKCWIWKYCIPMRRFKCNCLKSYKQKLNKSLKESSKVCTMWRISSKGSRGSSSTSNKKELLLRRKTRSSITRRILPNSFSRVNTNNRKMRENKKTRPSQRDERRRM